MGEDERTLPHRYALEPGDRPSEAIYSAVAEVEDCSSLDVTPLGEVIDPDALDTLLTGRSEPVEISFHYCGYDVTATPGEVRIEASETQ